MAGQIFRYGGLSLAVFLALATTGAANAQEALSWMNSVRSDFAQPELLSNESLIDQIGSQNHAVIDQSVPLGGSGHYAEINQDGQSNLASVSQTGSADHARVNQTGLSNTVSATQDGSGNSLDLAQTGSGNVFDIAQTGDGNVFQGAQVGDYNNITATMNWAPATTVVEIGDQNAIIVHLDAASPNVSVTILGSGISVDVH
jgi:hypothetical protein